MLRPTTKQLKFLAAYGSGHSFQQACDLAGVSDSQENRLTFLDRMWSNGWLSVTVTDAGRQAVEGEHGKDRRVD